MAVPLTIIHVPHSSPLIPSAIRRTLALTDQELQHELLVMTDWYTDTLFSMPAMAAKTVIFPVSRLVVDPERFADDDREPMAAKGMGVIYAKTSRGQVLRQEMPEEERNRLLTTYYYSHQQRTRGAAQAALADYGRCLLVDAHSFASKPLPHEPDRTPDRCQICIGTDDFHTPPWLIEWLTTAFRRRGFDVAVNRPFSGTFTPTEFFRENPSVLSVMVEVNRSLYMDEVTGERHAGFDRCRAQVQAVLSEMTARVGQQSQMESADVGDHHANTI